MVTGWVKTLEEQGAIVAQYRSQVPEILGREDLTLDQALILLRIIIKGSQTLDRIVSEMRAANLQQPFFDAAGALQEIYQLLAAATDKKITALRRRRLVVITH